MGLPGQGPRPDQAQHSLCRECGKSGHALNWQAGEGERARLVVLAGEVGGRWSAETASFLTALAEHKAQGVKHW